ncbi:hypothetical protein THAOC_15287, partial [Thalassiosira oceanica]
RSREEAVDAEAPRRLRDAGPVVLVQPASFGQRAWDDPGRVEVVIRKLQRHVRVERPSLAPDVAGAPERHPERPPNGRSRRRIRHAVSPRLRRRWVSIAVGTLGRRNLRCSLGLKPPGPTRGPLGLLDDLETRALGNPEGPRPSQVMPGAGTVESGRARTAGANLPGQGTAGQGEGWNRGVVVGLLGKVCEESPTE